MSTTAMTLTVNGKPVDGTVEPRTSLADFLREDLLLTGTHIGCEQGVCGACTVMVDGRPVRSCISLAVSCQGAEVRTVEGYGDDPLMAKIRAAFSRHHGLQCGYCTPGMLATAYDIVRRVPDADDARIRKELSGNLCRCTGYSGIVNAVADVLANDPPAPALVPKPRVALNEGSASGPAVVTSAPAAAAASVSSAPLPDRDALKGATAMTRSLSIDAPPADVWAVLRDPARVVACVPGASLGARDGDRFEGTCTVTVGPMEASFRGTGELALNETARSGTLRGRGQDSASRSGLDGVLDFGVTENGAGGTTLRLDMLYRLTGPLAQVGRPALVAEIADRLLARIGAALAAEATGRTADLPPAKPVGGISLVFGAIFAVIKRAITGR